MFYFFFFNDTATTEIYTLSLHDALPIFAPDKSLADECVYLINFFPEDDLIALFNHFPEGSRIALLFPENAYGYYINHIIDPIADESSSLIVNRASYKEDLTNAR